MGTLKGVVEYHGQQHKFSAVASISGKSIIVSCEHPSGEKKYWTMKIESVNGFPKIIITGSLPSTILTSSGDFKTEMIMHNFFQYTVKHIHNSEEMLKVKLSLATGSLVDCTILFGTGLKYNTQITVDYMNGFPKVLINGYVPNTFLFNSGRFECQLVMHHLLHYSVKHVHNGEEMLKVKVTAAEGKLLDCSVLFGTGLKYNTHVIVDHVNRFPKMVLQGKLPNILMQSVAEFKTELITHSLFHYSVSHVYNGQELLKVKATIAQGKFLQCTVLFGQNLKYNTEFAMDYVTGFPKMTVTGKIPNIFMFTEAEFKTELAMKNIFHYTFKHVYNGQEILTVKTTLASSNVLECSVLFGNGLTYNTNIVVKTVAGFPRLAITGKIPNIFLMKVATIETELTMDNLFEYSGRFVYNGEEVFKFKTNVAKGKLIEGTVLFGKSLMYNTKIMINHVNGYPKMFMTGKVPTIFLTSTAEFSTEIIMHNLFSYSVSHQYNGQKILDVTASAGTAKFIECTAQFGFGLKHNVHLEVEYVNGFPKMLVTGQMPLVQFETELLTQNLFQYSLKHIFHGHEILNAKVVVGSGKVVECTMQFGKGLKYNTHLMVELVNRLPKVILTGKVPLAAFKTEFTMQSLYDCTLMHTLNGQEILKLKVTTGKGKFFECTILFGKGLTYNTQFVVDHTNGFPHLLITGKIPMVAFETTLAMHNLKQYGIQQKLNGQDLLKTKVTVAQGKFIECTILFGKGLIYSTNLVVDLVNGLPKVMLTGKIPLATFMTELIMPSLTECTLKHTLNGQEILNLKVVATKGKLLECTVLFGKGLTYNTQLVVDLVSGFPQVLITGKVPMIEFETGIIMHSLYQYSIKQVFNGQEILKTKVIVAQEKKIECTLQFGYGLIYNTHLMVDLTKGFPKMVITGKVPMVEFTTEFFMQNINQYTLQHTFNGKKIFKANIIVAKEKFLECKLMFGIDLMYNTFLSVDYVNGFPKMVITGKVPMVSFETVIHMEDLYQYSVKHILNGQNILKANIVVAKGKLFDCIILFGTGLQYKTQWSVDYVNGFPKMTITGNVPMANFATYVTMHNLHEYTMTHVFNGQEIFNTKAVVAKGKLLECTMLFGIGLKYNTQLSLDYVNGLPMLAVTGNWPIAAFETELAMNSFDDYSIKHIFNGLGIFNTKVTVAKGKLFECTMLYGIGLKYNTHVMVDYVNGLPKMVITGKLPLVASETNMIMHSIHQSSISTVVNGQEIFKSKVTFAKGKLFECNMMFGIGLKYNALLTVEYVNGYPKMVIAAKMPIFEFETDLIMYNFQEFAIKHIINGLEIFSTKVVVAKGKLLDCTMLFGVGQEYNYHFSIDYATGFPKIMITGKIPLAAFETEVVMHSLNQYSAKTTINGHEIFNTKVVVAQGKLLDFTVLYGIGLNYKTNLMINNINGFPQMTISGVVPMVAFNTEIVMKNPHQYTVKHVFNGETLFNAQLSIAQTKLFDCVAEFGFGLKYNIHLLMDYVYGLPKITVTGNWPLIKFTTDVTMKNIFHWSVTHVVNGWEMINVDVTLAEGNLLECTVLFSKKQVLHFKVEYANNTVKLIFPKTNFWLLDHKNFEVEWAFIPTNPANLWQGGNVKFAVLRQDTPLLKIGGFINLTFNSELIHIVFNNWTINIMQPTLMKLLPITALEGEVLVNLKTMKWLPKVTYEMKLLKETTKIFHVIFSTNETPFKLHVCCPFLINTILNIQNLEYVKLEMTTLVKGNEVINTVVCNLTTKKIIVKITPTMITLEVMDGTISLIKFINELNVVKETDKKYAVDGKTGIQLDKASVVYKTLCEFTPICFNDLTKKVHLDIEDLLAGKFAFDTAATKDTTEIYHVEVTTVATPKKIMVKIPILKFETIVQFDMTTQTCKWIVNVMKWQNILMLRPTAGGSFEIVLNETPIMKLQRIDTKISLVVAEIPIMELERIDKTVRIILIQTPILSLELSDNGVTFIVKDVKLVKLELLQKKVRVTSMIQNIPTITAIITYRTLSIFDNTIGVEVTLGKLSNKILLAWNINQPMKAFVDLKIIGNGIFVGNYELTHHINWNIKGIHFIDLAWNGKILCTGIKYLATPVVTDGTAIVKDFVVDMKVVEMYNKEPYTMIFKTHPLKIALLPFFQYP